MVMRNKVFSFGKGRSWATCKAGATGSANATELQGGAAYRNRIYINSRAIYKMHNAPLTPHTPRP